MRSIPHTTWVPEFQNNHAGKKQKYISQELPLRLLQTVGISGWTLCNWLAAIKALYHRGVLADGCLNGFESSLMNGVVHQDQPVPAGIFWATGLLLEVNRSHLQNKHAHTHTTHKQMYSKVVRAGKLQSWIFLQCRSKHHSTFLGYIKDFSWKNLQIFTTWAAWTFQRMQAPDGTCIPSVHATTSLLGPGSSVMRFGTSPKAEVALRRPKSK